VGGMSSDCDVKGRGDRVHRGRREERDDDPRGVRAPAAEYIAELSARPCDRCGRKRGPERAETGASHRARTRRLVTGPGHRGGQGEHPGDAAGEREVDARTSRAREGERLVLSMLPFECHGGDDNRERERFPRGSSIRFSTSERSSCSSERGRRYSVEGAGTRGGRRSGVETRSLMDEARRAATELRPSMNEPSSVDRDARSRSNESPFRTNEARIRTNEAPSQTNEAPLPASDAHVRTNEAPSPTSEPRARTNEAFLLAREPHARRNEAPSPTSEPRARTNEAPSPTSEARFPTMEAL